MFDLKDRDIITYEIKSNRVNTGECALLLNTSLEGILFCQMHDKGYITDEELKHKMNEIREKYNLYMMW